MASKPPITNQNLCGKIKEQFEKVSGCPWGEVSMQKLPKEQEIPIIDEMTLFRDLLLLLSQTKDQELKMVASANFSFLLMRELGLRTFLASSFDLDESSQIKTTLDQRFVAVSNLIAFMPAIASSLDEYFDSIARQVLKLLTEDSNASDSTRNNLRKLATHIVNGFIKRNKKLATKFFISPIIDSMKMKSSDLAYLSSQEVIEIVYSLTLCHFNVKHFIPIFPQLFYARIKLDSTLSVYKSKLTQTLTEILLNVDHSIHLVDDCLFNHFHDWANAFSTTINTDGQVTLIFGKEEPPTRTEVNLKLVDTTSHFALELIIKSVNEESLVDFSLLLLERMNMVKVMSPSTSLILFSLLPAIQEKIETVLSKYPGKWIRFVSESFRQAIEDNETNRLIPSDCPTTESSEEESVANNIKVDNLSITLQILQILLTEKRNLKGDDVRALKEVLPLIEKILSTRKFPEDFDEAQLINLKEQIETLDEDTTIQEPRKEESLYNQAMKDLNDPLMPTRAHALIVLKNLVMQKDPVLVKNQKHLLQLLQTSLADPESYIYLSTINCLAALSILSTDEVLPLLLSSLINENRTIQERLNVAEVLVRLSKSLGPMSAKYAKEFVSAISVGLKENDDIIRVSSLSILGHFCGNLKYALGPFIPTILFDIECLVNSDPCLDVRRAGLMFFHLILREADMNVVMTMKDSFARIHEVAQRIHNNSLDDVSRLHAQLTLEELDRISKDYLKEKTQGLKLIQFVD